MRTQLSNYYPWRGLAVAVAACSLLATRGSAQTVTLDSFENPTGVARFVSSGSQIYISHAQSNIGVTNGANSMLLVMEGAEDEDNFGWGAIGGWAVQGDFLPSDTDLTGYAAFQAAAANPSRWNLEFDITTNAQSFVNALPNGQTRATIQVGLSYDGGFGQRVGANLYGTNGKNTVSFKLSDLAQANVPIPTASSFYQVLIGSSANRWRTDDPLTGANFYIDKLRLRPAPTLAPPETLFSWETLDNAGTPNVNEAFEGWDDLGLNPPAPAPVPTALNDRFTHKHSVTPYGATHGTKALMIDTTIQNPINTFVVDGSAPLNHTSYQFHWGSTYRLNADTNPDPMVTTIDPAIQAQVAALAGKLNRAFAIQFDATFSHPGGSAFVPGDPDPYTLDPTVPGFFDFEMFIADNRGTFFQFDPGALNGDQVNAFYNNTYEGAPLTPERTFTLPLSSFSNLNTATVGTIPNAASGFPLDLTSLSMGLSTNGGPVVAHIDNFRIVPILGADFDRDLDVDGNDLAIWKTAFNAQTDAGDADQDGDTDGNDFLLWQRQKGTIGTFPGVAASAPVPEPASAAIVAIGALWIGGLRRRSAA